MFLAIDFVLLIFFIGIVQTGGFILGCNLPTVLLGILFVSIHLSGFMQGRFSVLTQDEENKPM